MMLAISTIVLCLFAVTFHELGHAWAMRTVGVPIKTFSLLGFKVPKLPYLRFPFNLPGQKDPVSVEIHPLLIGAYVQAEESSMKSLSVKDAAFVFGAGPFASFLYGFVMLGVTILINSRGSLMVFSTLAIIVAGMVLFNRIICRYGVLAIGVLFLAFLLWYTFQHPQEVASSMGGPVMTAQKLHGQYAEAASHHMELSAVFFLPGILSVSLGLVNAFPFVPLDGGHIVRLYLNKLYPKAANAFTSISVVLFLLLLAASMFGDLGVLAGGIAKFFS